MHAHRVDIFDGTDDNAIVGLVAHDFHLVLFPAKHGFVDHHLTHGRGVEATGHDGVEFFAVISDAAAATAHGEARADDGGKPDGFQRFTRFIERFHHEIFWHLKADARHRIAEQLAVFRFVDGCELRADQLHIIFLQNAAFRQRLGAVERGLAAHRGQQRIGAFTGDDFLDIFRRDWLDIGGIGQIRIGHDRRRIAVHQNHTEAFGFEGFDRLRAGVIELACLPDDDRPRADDKDTFNVSTFRHQAAFFLLVVIISTNCLNRYCESCGPGLASGCPCTEKIGLILWRMPWIVPSNSERCVTSISLGSA